MALGADHADRAAVAGCSSLGIVTDDDLKDMQKKAAKLGGNTVVIFATTQGVQRGPVRGTVITQIHSGEVYRCGAARP